MSSNEAIFLVGVLVTCLVVVACSVLFWAAREDGRENDRLIPRDRSPSDA